MSDYRVRRGDTLSQIARRNNTSVDALARANNISDPNKLREGQALVVPGGQTRPEARPSQPRPEARPASSPVTAERQRDSFAPVEAPRTEGGTRTWTDPANSDRSFSSRDGVPRFNQADAAWASRRLGGTGEVGSASRDSIRAKGCAITASAMAVSALSGRTITPREMDAHLDRNGGYSGNAVNFGQVGGVTGGEPRITATRMRGNLTADGIDQQLDAGRPVLVGVNWRTNNTATPDHWVTITGRNADGSYRANDPNGGREITLRRDGNGLVSTRADGAPHDYRFSGQGVTFAGGRPVRPQGNGQDDFTTAPAQRAQAAAGPAATGSNAILNDLQTQGASAATAGQDRAPAGVAGSQQMAETDRARLERYQDVFRQVGAQYNLPPALLAAIASRESRGGAALLENGNARFDPNGYGLMQIDRLHNPGLIQGGPYSTEHVAAAAGLLQRNLETVRQAHPTWSAAEQLRGAVAAYNAGPGNVRTLERMDVGTTGNDYSGDVWARAQYLASRGF
ncbi:LysM peptidoglycan-binding domain-containing protein [Vitiosangium sp. GDMCC 1.1324]|uniref:LysM peptidoglycan-binding domain-containing protein n=1 Tax=Vitiosangium sp. (strain GDMCC 1.1324) TaxID=2138576 RepID=UPI000D37213D|nr:LysM peptidoglycan-binding domain-containing protein [Vitiosangium sp. GDMCC 1.1324]PTL81580.1 hypothetical protein DAT35_21715 [Vitiosangium sp. GDMCC 1.1324]